MTDGAERINTWSTRLVYVVRRSVRAVVGMVLRWYGFPVFARYPRVVVRLGILLFRRTEEPCYYYTRHDFWQRTIYRKVSWNFREHGRNGYVFDEGLGLPMRSRFFVNRVTYSVYGWMSARAFSTLCLGAFLFAVLATGYLVGQPETTVAAALALLVCPAVVFTLVGYGVKPETLWWSAAIPALVAGIHGNWVLAWSILGGMMFLNTSVSFLLGGLLGGIWMAGVMTGQAVSAKDFLLLLPGGMKQAWRFVVAYRDGYLTSQTSDQKRMVRDRRLSVDETVRLVLFFVLPLGVAGWQRPWMALALGASVLAIYWWNSRVFKIGDVVTIRLLFLVVIVAAGLSSGMPFGLFGILLHAFWDPFYDPFRCLVPESVRQQVSACRDEGWRTMRLYDGYPWLTSRPFPRPAGLVRLLEQIPSGVRVLIESEGDPRTEGGGYTRLRNWTYEMLTDRHVEVVNQTYYLRVAERQLADEYLNRFSARLLSPTVMFDVCQQLGVSRVLVYSAETETALQGFGFKVLGRMETGSDDVFFNMIGLADTTLCLMETPGVLSVLDPPVAVERHRNTISWQGEAGVNYVLRYRYLPSVSAWQDGRQLPVLPWQAPGLPVRFVQVKAAETGRISADFGVTR